MGTDTSNTKLTRLPADENVNEILDTTLRAEARALAAAHTPEAINVIVRMMKSTKTPPSVRRACAMDLLNYAHGPSGLDRDERTQTQRTGLTINILRLGDEEKDAARQMLKQLAGIEDA